LEVEKVRPIEPRWHIMSLNVLNEGKDVPEEYREAIARAIGPVRVVGAAVAKYGERVGGPLYTELGTRVHNQGALGRLDALHETVRDAPSAGRRGPALPAAVDSTEYAEAGRRSHERGITLVGQEVGTPVIAVGETAVFGPVITSIPRGEEAGRLWDGVLLVTEFGEFFELK